MRLEGAQISLERIGVDEEVRRLDQEELLVLGEIADRPFEEVAGRRVVGIEDGDEPPVKRPTPLLRLPALA